MKSLPKTQSKMNKPPFSKDSTPSPKNSSADIPTWSKETSRPTKWWARWKSSSRATKKKSKIWRKWKLILQWRIIKSWWMISTSSMIITRCINKWARSSRGSCRRAITERGHSWSYSRRPMSLENRPRSSSRSMISYMIIMMTLVVSKSSSKFATKFRSQCWTCQSSTSSSKKVTNLRVNRMQQTSPTVLTPTILLKMTFQWSSIQNRTLMRRN